MLKTNINAKNKQIDYCEKQTLILRIITNEQLYIYVLTKNAHFHQYIDQFSMNCLRTFTK